MAPGPAAYSAAVRTGLCRAYLAASVVGSRLVSASKTGGGVGKVGVQGATLAARLLPWTFFKCACVCVVVCGCLACARCVCMVACGCVRAVFCACGVCVCVVACRCLVWCVRCVCGGGRLAWVCCVGVLCRVSGSTLAILCASPRSLVPAVERTNQFSAAMCSNRGFPLTLGVCWWTSISCGERARSCVCLSSRQVPP